MGEEWRGKKRKLKIQTGQKSRGRAKKEGKKIIKTSASRFEYK